MKERLVKAFGLLALLSLLSLAVACGDDDEEPSVESTGSTGSSEAQPTQPASGAATSDDSREGWPDTFTLGLFGGDDADEVVLKAEPLKELLEAELDIPVEVFTGTSYTAVIEAMRAGRVDAMEVGPFAYILAVQEANAEAIAVTTSESGEYDAFDETVAPFYMSVIFTKKGSGVTSLEDIRGKGFNFVDPASTSGHLAPKTLLINRGFNPDEDFQTVFAGSHPTSVLSVWEDKAAAGATFEGNLQRLVAEGQVEWCEWPDGRIGVVRTQEEIDAHFQTCPDGSLAVLAQSDPIPNTPFAVSQDLPQSLKDALKEVLLSTPERPEFISGSKVWYLDPSEERGLESLDQLYNPLRDIARLLNLDLKELAEG